MGSFATSIFNLMLGWIRGLVSSLWGLINGPEARESLIWLGENWFWVVGIIALAGLVIDYVIWFIRWRPYYVWRSWFHRLTHRKVFEEEPAYAQPAYEEEPQAEYQEVYYEEDWQEPEHPGLSETGLQESLGWPPQEAYQEAYAESYPEAYEEAEPAVAAQRHRRSQREHRQREMPFGRMRAGISQMAQRMDFMGLGQEDEDEEDYSYQPPPPAVDKNQAFHAPVYPSRRAAQEDNE